MTESDDSRRQTLDAAVKNDDWSSIIDFPNTGNKVVKPAVCGMERASFWYG